MAAVVITTKDPTMEHKVPCLGSFKGTAKNMKIETAIMLENRNILFAINRRLPDGELSSSNQEITPEDAEYEFVCKCFNLNEPGDAYINRHNWADMNWIVDTVEVL